MGRLEGHVVLVTGSTKGIGRAIALQAAAEGACTVVAGRTTEAGEQVVDEARGAGGEAVFTRLDIDDEASVAAAVDAAVAAYGSLTGLVCNAAEVGQTGDAPITEISLDEWDLRLRTNLTGTFLTCKYGIKAIVAGGRPGSVVLVASTAASVGVVGIDAYTAAKGALVALNRSVAAYYGRYDIRSNCLAVGTIDTGGPTVRSLLADDTYADAAYRRCLGRLGRPEDVANTTCFLLSDEAAFITAALIPVDGGQTGAAHVPKPTVPDLPGFPRLRAKYPPC